MKSKTLQTIVLLWNYMDGSFWNISGLVVSDTPFKNVGYLIELVELFVPFVLCNPSNLWAQLPFLIL